MLVLLKITRIIFILFTQIWVVLVVAMVTYCRPLVSECWEVAVLLVSVIVIITVVSRGEGNDVGGGVGLHHHHHQW